MDHLFKDILTARVYDIAKRAPLELAEQISHRLDNRVYFKREDLQDVHSFKIRGAYNKIVHLAPHQRQKGVICASAGNHGQGVAASARALGIPATVVMPETTPSIKVAAVKRLGAQVVLFGDHYSAAGEHCLTLAEASGAALIPPFDDLKVVAGQGTIGKEIYEDLSDVDMVFVPCGGGGLLAGVAAYLKEIQPSIQVIGVEPDDSAAMSRSLEEGHLVTLEEVGLFADGVAVKRVGELTFELCRRYVDDMVQVSTDDMASAISDIYQDTRAIVEPAGALALAGLKKHQRQLGYQNRSIVVINSGANMNFQRLQFVAERALTGAGREALYAVTLKDQPGTLKELYARVLAGKAITEFNYRKSSHIKASGHIFLGVGITGEGERLLLEQRLGEAGYPYHDLTQNELAKVHLRHLMGGKGPRDQGERLIHFAFPERPGALGEFLDLLSERWNISLFHYRSSGADFGRVLIGFEVQDDDEPAFQSFINQLHFPFRDETKNPAYTLFL